MWKRGPLPTTPRTPRHFMQPSVRGALAAVVAAALVLLLVVRVIAASSAAAHLDRSGVVGRAAPDFTIQVWNGVGSPTVRLANQHGKPIVLNFWASWCVPCKEEAPVLRAAWQKYAPRGAVFIGVALQTSRADLIGFTSRYRIPYPCGPDTSGSISTAYGTTGIPTTIFIDREGVVVKKFTGQISAAELNQDVQALLW
ncbi:MAG: TlpA family protein disulfide reductase [Ktedonobacterales bacterium]|nr:TlpA family protein disulfide reductase [Ktedonobacterales bacterium]